MNTRLTPQIVDVARFRDGVLVTFEDGRCALYSATLLAALYPQAEEAFEPHPED
jgi:hypothetical protein